MAIPVSPEQKDNTIAVKKFPLITLLILVVVALIGTAAPRGISQKQRAAKARYYYLEGARLQATGQNDAAYEMFRHAYNIDSTYAEAALEYGTNRVILENDSITPDDNLRALEIVRSFVDKYPGDFIENRLYAYMASQLDTNPEAIRVYERLAENFPDKSAIQLYLADAYIRCDSVKKAVEALDKYEEMEGQSFSLSSRKANYLFSVHDTVGAIGVADRLIRDNPASEDGYLLRGMINMAVDQRDSALRDFLIADSISPEQATSKIMLANFYQDSDSVLYDKYIYESLINENVGLDSKMEILAEYLRHLLENDNDRARGDMLFDVLTNQYPFEPMVLELAARYSYEKNNYKEAIERISGAIDLDPTNEEFYKALMTYQLNLNQFKEAMETFQRAKKFVDPGPDMKLVYATTALGAEDFHEAEKMFAELIHGYVPDAPLSSPVKINSDIRALDYPSLAQLSVLYGLLGDLYTSADNIEKACGAYENAVSLFPDNYMTMNNYAYQLAQLGDTLQLPRAADMSAKTVENNPDNPTFLDTYAYILFKQKKYPEALEKQKKAIELMESQNKEVEAVYYEHLGDIYFMEGDKENALKNWKKALEIDPSSKLVKKKIEKKAYFPDELPSEPKI